MRVIEKVHNEDEKVPLFCDEPPHFFEKVDVFSQRVFGLHREAKYLFAEFSTKHEARW